MNREERELKAKNWLNHINKEYSEDIKQAIDNSVLYEYSPRYVPTNILFKGTVEQFLEEFGGQARMGVLNFASYTRPGGGFTTGAIAQEEALCHVTTLYPVLKHFQERFYNQNTEPAPFYSDKAIFSNDIIYVNQSGKPVNIAVLTCAAPNLSGCYRTAKPIPDGYEKVMRDRIKFILDIFENNACRNIVLGAFGCGVFKNPPEVVARIFKEELIGRDFDYVYFPIPDGPNYAAFAKIFP